MRARTRAAWITLTLAALVCGGPGALAAPPSAPPRAITPASATPASSAMTLKGAGPFADLEVRVAKTAGLVNEVVEVTWKGGAPSQPIGGFRRNFLQIMQCWGEDPSGPRPTQCQFGAIAALVSDSNTGTAVRTRQILGGLPIDPAETTPANGPAGTGFIPFEAANGTTVGGSFSGFNAFFDAQGSNELPLNTTRGDGTGQDFFEVQTAAEAPGLGCGKLVSRPGAAPAARTCWLVVVPRSDREVDNTVRNEDSGTTDEAKRLESSPLSASNWKHRIAFPLGFAPIGGSCPLGANQLPVLGQENATEAISRWQQSLCAATGAVFDFVQVPDDGARASLAGRTPSFSIVTRPAAATPRGPAVYAPLAISGVAVAYILEAQVPSNAPEPALQRAGQRISALKLTPRLVAKLLSQSYTQGVTVPAPLGNNPARLEDDPEFTALNPQLRGINPRVGSASIATVITSLNPSDATALVWQWIAADTEAREFLAGTPDAFGMRVNPQWKGASLTRADFPKLDQTCRPGDGDGDLCMPDAFPYANDMHEAVRAAARGDTLARTNWDRFARPPTYRRAGPQAKGRRAIMVISDTATAARFNLPTALLRNAKGQFVAPTAQSMSAAVGAMSRTAAGTLAPNPAGAPSSAYPLTMISYGATVPAALSAVQRRAYTGLISYAAGKGQTPDSVGGLPAGYAPLTAPLRQAATSAVTSIMKATTPPGAALIPPGRPPVGPAVPPALGPAPDGASSSGGAAAPAAPTQPVLAEPPGPAIPATPAGDGPTDPPIQGASGTAQDTLRPSLSVVPPAGTPPAQTNPTAQGLLWILVAALTAFALARSRSALLGLAAASRISRRRGPGTGMRQGVMPAPHLSTLKP
ncbi:MAG: hypothetical protein ACT4PP_16895 [Sporichthyaceae bacterium]